MIITASKTIAAAGNYTAGDIVSDSATAGTAWEFTHIRLYEGRNGIITGGVITCDEDSVTARYRLWLFTMTPSTSQLDDNVAKATTAADLKNCIGYVDFEAMTDQGTGSFAKGTAYLDFILAEGSLSLYGLLEDLSGEANETASMVIQISLGIEDVR